MGETTRKINFVSRKWRRFFVGIRVAVKYNLPWIAPLLGSRLTQRLFDILGLKEL